MDNLIELKQEEDQFEEMIQGLIDNKFGCTDTFFDASIILGLRNNLNRFCDDNYLQAAGMGNKNELKQDSAYRGDTIKWIEKSTIDAFENQFLKKVDNFKKHINKTCFTSIVDFESHYANYGPNSCYKKHIDQFKTDKGRQFSLVLYLNSDWLAEDGGMLSLYPEGEKQNDISPIGGRMVFFRSDEMEHEVHPSLTRNRLSIAGWFKN
jgi:SM-20-related protein